MFFRLEYIRIMVLECIVHYKNQAEYSTIKKLSETNKRRILEAKAVRESNISNHNHADQCSMVPEQFEDDEHGVHLNPCYKR